MCINYFRRNQVFIAFGNLNGDSFHGNVMVILITTAVDRWSLYYLYYDVSLISDQVFRMRTWPMSSWDNLVLSTELII